MHENVTAPHYTPGSFATPKPRRRWPAFIGGALLGLILGGCTGAVAGGTAKEVSRPVGSLDVATVRPIPSSSGGSEAATPDSPAPSPSATVVGSTCAKAREAILTGSSTEITAALEDLRKDKDAPAVAREYAQNYLVRDKGDAQLRSMDVDLIRTTCTGVN